MTRFRNIAFSLCAFAITLLACGFALAQNTATGEDSSVTLVAFTAPPAAAGTPVKYTFQVKNPTKKTWTIKSARASCGCLQIEKVPKVIQIGKTGSVSVVLDTTGRNGVLTQSVYLELDQESPRMVELRLTAQIPAVWFDETVIHLGDIGAGESGSRELRILSFSLGDDNEITALKSTHPALSAKLVGNEDLGTKFAPYDGYRLLRRVRLTINAKDASPGFFTGLIVAETSSGRSAELRVNANVGSSIELLPAAAYFGPIRGGQSVTRECLIPNEHWERASSVRLIVQSEDATAAEIAKATIRKDKDKTWVSVTIKPPEGAKLQTLVGKIRGETNEGVELFTVPYAAVVVP